MTALLQILLLGMATGGFYTINALGVVVVFRSSGVINFASGGTAMLGGYLEWQFADQWGWSAPVAVLTAVAGAGLAGLAIFLIAIRPLSSAATLTIVTATLAVLVSLQQGLLLIFGGLPKVPTAFLPSSTVHLGSLEIGADSLTLLGASAALTLALWAVYRWTRFGLATSALAESPRSLASLGWNMTRLRAANWAIGGALTGLAGATLGPILQLTPSTFYYLLIPTLACALIGELKSFPLTLAGGLLVGAAQAAAGRYVSWTGFATAVPFLLIVAVLTLRGRSLPLRSFVHERLPRVGSGEVNRVGLAVAVAVAAVFALAAQQDWVIGATVTLAAAIILLSQVVITGYAGQLSLAQLTLAGVGAVTAANLAAAYNLPFLLSLVAGMLVVIPASVLVGLPSVRSRGISLAIVTLGLAVTINAMVLTNSSLTGGLSGLTLAPQTLFGWSIDATLYPRRYFFVVLAVFVALALVTANVRRGRSGRRMLAVRNNERAARALGIDVVGVKLYAFTLAGTIAAAGGVLTVFSETIPQFAGFDPLTGLSSLIDAVLGGIGFIPGALIGGMFNNDGLPNAILYPVVGNLSWWTDFFPLVIGLALVLQLVANPDGIAAAGLPAFSRLRGLERRLGRFGTRSRPVNAAERHRARLDRELDAARRRPARPGGKALAVRDLRVAFGPTVVLDGVDIDVVPGQVLAVIGPNGAGKTTLMDAITGFVPATGEITLDGRRIDGVPAHRRSRAGIARSFQSLELFEDMTVMDNVRCAADPQDRMSFLLDLIRPQRGTLTQAAAAAVEALGLSAALDRLPAEIGYGDRRLVAIARALACAPSVLLLDEPAAGLSEFERGEVARVITAMAHEWNLAVILIEHDVNLVRQVSDQVVALDFGRVITAGVTADVLSHPEVVRAYLGSDEPVAGERPLPAVPSSPAGPGPASPAPGNAPAARRSGTNPPRGEPDRRRTSKRS